MEPINQGCVTLTDVWYKLIDYSPCEDTQADYFPEFIVTGTINIAGVKREFHRSVSLELDGRDADEKHISGYNYDDDYTVDQGAITEDLYNAIYASTVYQNIANVYHGTNKENT